MGRICADCGRDLPQTSYTANQWSKGYGYSRCAGCVHGHYSDTPAAQQSDAGRYNLSSRASYTDDALENPFASGAFRWVAKGTYTEGPRQGQASVLKWFKTGAVFEDDYFALDIKASSKALEIVNRFNQLGVVDKTVKINVPNVWVFNDDAGPLSRQKGLSEPFIQNYQKFNNNTATISGGNYVLYDLQGGIYQQELVLSDPVILSQTREYGVTDLGPNGISSFFSQHSCNSYCRPNWTKPASPRAYFNPVPGTTMIRRLVPPAMSKPKSTRYYGGY
ncbi:kinase-like domain-containing protein [Corynascus novoguineensis]|uniref:Kinase-like domain-containing protein n=1 Tax=Corynascus novoguineensis TaxID=1126955 RepID=A0AAN7CJX5_9PEZI|nr:kinase-like domain-containing protein [Corynascus novoguineensis]